MSVPADLARRARYLGHDLDPDATFTDTGDIYRCRSCGCSLIVGPLSQGFGSALQENCAERRADFLRQLRHVAQNSTA